jgi:hypothetical protein
MKLVPPTAQHDAAVSDADLKTLKLSTPLVTPEGLGRYLAFQRAYVEYLEKLDARGTDSLAKAHESAAASSGAHIDEISRIGAICTDFAGRRSVELTIKARREKVRESIEAARAAGEPASEKDLETEQRIAEQLAGPSVLDQLQRRYGADAVEALRAREGDILELHRRQTAVHL